MLPLQIRYGSWQVAHTTLIHPTVNQRTYLSSFARRQCCWQNRNGELSQQRRQQSKSGQRQSIFNVKLTPERDTQHLWTVGGGRAHWEKERAQKTTQLSGFAKSVGGKNENRYGEMTQQPSQRVTSGRWHSICNIELTPERHFQHIWTTGGRWALQLQKAHAIDATRQRTSKLRRGLP